MRSFSNITLKFANKLHLLVDSLGVGTMFLPLKKTSGKGCSLLINA